MPNGRLCTCYILLFMPNNEMTHDIIFYCIGYPVSNDELELDGVDIRRELLFQRRLL